MNKFEIDGEVFEAITTDVPRAGVVHVDPVKRARSKVQVVQRGDALCLKYGTTFLKQGERGFFRFPITGKAPDKIEKLTKAMTEAAANGQFDNLLLPVMKGYQVTATKRKAKKTA